MFRLQLSDHTINEDGIEEYEGVIIIGDFRERFFSEKKFFDKKNYYQQWEKAVSRIIDGGNSYFLTSLDDPSHSNYYMGWTVYNYKNDIFVQNKIFLSSQFSLHDVLKMTLDLPEFSKITEDGEDVSTWKTTMQEIEEYGIFLKEFLDFQQE